MGFLQQSQEPALASTADCATTLFHASIGIQHEYTPLPQQQLQMQSKNMLTSADIKMRQVRP
jgi:hypothetical protein